MSPKSGITGMAGYTGKTGQLWCNTMLMVARGSKYIVATACYIATLSREQPGLNVATMLLLPRAIMFTANHIATRGMGHGTLAVPSQASFIENCILIQ